MSLGNALFLHLLCSAVNANLTRYWGGPNLQISCKSTGRDRIEQIRFGLCVAVEESTV